MTLHPPAYSAEPRPDTGVTNAMLGTWLFLASEAMLFGSLFSAYALLRTGAARWPVQSDMLSVSAGTQNTIVLLAATGAVTAGRLALGRGALVPFIRASWVAVVLALAFIANKGMEYSAEIGVGFLPSTTNFAGIYFILTGLHLAHVVGGVIVTAWLAGTASRVWTANAELLRVRVRAVTLYWLFVDGVWLAIFLTVYLL